MLLSNFPFSVQNLMWSFVMEFQFAFQFLNYQDQRLVMTHFRKKYYIKSDSSNFFFFFSLPKILFYCHHPDLLLTRKKSVLRSLYRAPIDFMEEITTAAADQTLVNSNYTREIFKRTFKTIPSDPAILYPTVYVS